MTSVLTHAECPKGRLLSLPSSMWDEDHCTVNSWGPPSLARLHQSTSRHRQQQHATKEPLWPTSLKWPLSLSWVSGCLTNFFHASFFSFTPSPFFRGLFSSPLLFLSVAPTERTETDTPPSQRFVCQYGQLGSGTKAQWRCPHTATPHPPAKQAPNRLPHSPHTPLFRYLPSLSFNDKAFTFKEFKVSG